MSRQRIVHQETRQARVPVGPAHRERIEIAVGRAAFATARNERGFAQRVTPAQARQPQRQVDQRRIPGGIAVGIEAAGLASRAAAQQYGVIDRSRQFRMPRRHRGGGLGEALGFVRQRSDLAATGPGRGFAGVTPGVAGRRGIARETGGKLAGPTRSGMASAASTITSLSPQAFSASSRCAT